MPIDARIPLGVTPIDPNGFTNALAAGMKMRELQNASERLARKEEAAEFETNALAKYGASKRTKEDLDTLYAEAPDKARVFEKNAREADLAGIQAKQHQANWAKANHGLLAEASGAILANPTRENANMVLDGLEAQGGDMSRPRKQLETAPDQAIVTLAKGWAGNAQKVRQMALAEEKAAKPDWVETDDGWVDRNTLGGGGEPAAPAPAGRAPTVVLGGELPPPEDIDAAVLHRAGQGPAPTGNVDYEGLSDPGLDELQAASSASRKPAAPTPLVPPTLGGETRNQRQDRRDAVLDQRHADEQTAVNRRLEIAEQRQAAAEKKAEYANQISSGQRLTPADASKAQQKLVRIDVMKRQMAAVRAAWEGTKQAKGVKGTMAAGPGANIYAPGLLSEAGEKFDATVAGLVASKTAMLRTPGVGTMTDFDQKLDIADLPSRGTHEATTEQQLVAYENMIADMESGYRDLLAGPPEGPAEAEPAAPAAPPTATAQSDRPMPKPVQEFDSMPMPGEYAGKRIRTPDGGVYRSDGRQWVRQ